jgi:hypothetical protein
MPTRSATVAGSRFAASSKQRRHTDQLRGAHHAVAGDDLRGGDRPSRGGSRRLRGTGRRPLSRPRAGVPRCGRDRPRRGGVLVDSRQSAPLDAYLTTFFNTGWEHQGVYDEPTADLQHSRGIQQPIAPTQVTRNLHQPADLARDSTELACRQFASRWSRAGHCWAVLGPSGPSLGRRMSTNIDHRRPHNTGRNTR